MVLQNRTILVLQTYRMLLLQRSEYPNFAKPESLRVAKAAFIGMI